MKTVKIPRRSFVSHEKEEKKSIVPETGVDIEIFENRESSAKIKSVLVLEDGQQAQMREYTPFMQTRKLIEPDELSEKLRVERRR